jgi:hypothetical protein
VNSVTAAEKAPALLLIFFLRVEYTIFLRRNHAVLATVSDGARQENLGTDTKFS